MKKTTIIGVLWFAGITAGLIGEFANIMFFGFLSAFITVGAMATTAIYLMDNWYNFK